MATCLFAAYCAVCIGGLTAAESAARPSQELLLARSLQQSGQYQAALAVLLEALLLKPDSTLLLNQLGSVEQDLGQYVEAERYYLRALKASSQFDGTPELVLVRTNLATLYLDTGQYSKGDQLREQLEKAVSEAPYADPGSVAGLMNIIGSLEHTRNRDLEAEHYYSKALGLFRETKGPVSLDAAMVEANIGFLKLQAHQYEIAAELLWKSIREIEMAVDPGNPALIRPLLSLAVCENMRGSSLQAELAARRAVELSHKAFGEGHSVTATAMLEQATALRRLGRKGQARGLEKRARAWLKNDSKNSLSGYTVDVRAFTHPTDP